MVAMSLLKMCCIFPKKKIRNWRNSSESWFVSGASGGCSKFQQILFTLRKAAFHSQGDEIVTLLAEKHHIFGYCTTCYYKNRLTMIDPFIQVSPMYKKNTSHIEIYLGICISSFLPYLSKFLPCSCFGSPVLGRCVGRNWRCHCQQKPRKRMRNSAKRRKTITGES